jgi:serine/threonine protein kinase
MSRTDDPGLPAGADNSPGFLLHKEGYTIQDYRLIARIGEGSFGEVWKAERGGLPVALKILKTSMTSDETQRELKSLETLKKLHHKYLLHTDNFWSDGDRLFIEMELAEGGTLKERLKAYQAAGKAGIPEDELLKYFTEMAKALDYLHGHRPVFLHRDIKPANVLLVQGCAKLADFGLLRQVAGDNSSTKTQGGTFPYMAPESISSDVFSVYTDLFAFAVTYVELRQGELPFSGKNQYQICEKILREAPVLSDLFHPDEKKVLLKALEKDPKQRFTSCGEFVFELNRAVPWVPAVDVPILAPAPLPDQSASAKGTDPKQPSLTDPGTIRKKTPATMQEIALPPTGPAAPATDSKKQPAQDTAKPKPALAPPRPKLPTRALVGIALMVVGVASLTGIWLLANRGAQDGVRDLIAKGKYTEALQAIKNANRLVLPSGDALHKEVEDKWWSELKEPGQDAGPDALKRSLRELDKFTESFPNHDDVKPRRAKTQDLLLDAVARDVERWLNAREIGAARDAVTPNEEFLPNKGQALYDKIDAKQEVGAVLKRAGNKLDKNDFDGCLDELKLARVRFENKDLEEKNQILASAKTGAAIRDEAHKKRLAALEGLFAAKKTKELQIELAAMIQFRKDYPKADWDPPDLRKFQPRLLAKDLLAPAWKPFLDDIIVLEECRQGLKDFDGFLSLDKVIDPLYEKNLRALKALMSAHEASKDGWGKASDSLAALLRENNQPGDLNRNLWAALAQLENSRGLFRFEDLDALPNVPDDEAAKKASSVLFAQVLERLVKKDNYQWLPGTAERERCAVWCERRISDGNRSPRLMAFQAECLIESGAALEKINKIALPPKGDWYVSYVQALVKDKNKKPAEAADDLVGIVKENAKALNPRQRSDKAASIMRADLDLANADLMKSQWDQAIARSGRTQTFAYWWKSTALEDAAELNAKAVDVEVRAAFGKTKSGEEKVRVFERALKKADDKAADGFFVPVVVAKLEFAGAVLAKLEAKLPFADAEECPVSHLKQTMKEGETALERAKAAEESSKNMKQWWQTQRCKGLVNLADVHFLSLRKEKYDDGARREEFKKTLKLYTDARDMANYPGRWEGYLAMKIGLCNLALDEKKVAAQEFAASLKSLKAIPQPYPQAMQAELEIARNNLQQFIELLKNAN